MTRIGAVGRGLRVSANPSAGSVIGRCQGRLAAQFIPRLGLPLNSRYFLDTYGQKAATRPFRLTYPLMLVSSSLRTYSRASRAGSENGRSAGRRGRVRQSPPVAATGAIAERPGASDGLAHRKCRKGKEMRSMAAASLEVAAGVTGVPVPRSPAGSWGEEMGDGAGHGRDARATLVGGGRVRAPRPWNRGRGTSKDGWVKREQGSGVRASSRRGRERGSWRPGRDAGPTCRLGCQGAGSR